MKTGNQDSRIDDVIAKAASGVRGAVDKTAEASQHANQSIRKTARQLHKKEQQWAKSSGAYINRHPFLVVGCAVAAGFLLSKVLQRSESDE
ncbi:DUF883 domain-containing protein [Aliidiomarina sedimenti]|uniref:DUF883 domain-containing protein n=1 Tax=Aliidiomarina sedimenti TaxID=1933879 RepID=A0ABY0BVR1_9GAMM|nr:DUF883 domain-containing protein [Aliidiomarina sedimenti]RUO28138.1 DUF883 domain-containing protein [Aliidiomarina sedimenti]